MNLQSSIPDSQMYNTSRQYRVLGGLAAPSQAGMGSFSQATNNSMGAAARAQSLQDQSGAMAKMAASNLANQLAAQDARSGDLQNLASIYGQQYVDMAQRQNSQRQLAARQAVYDIDNASALRRQQMSWMESLLGDNDRQPSQYSLGRTFSAPSGRQPDYGRYEMPMYTGYSAPRVRGGSGGMPAGLQGSVGVLPYGSPAFGSAGITQYGRSNVSNMAPRTVGASPYASSGYGPGITTYARSAPVRPSPPPKTTMRPAAPREA